MQEQDLSIIDMGNNVERDGLIILIQILTGKIQFIGNNFL